MKKLILGLIAVIALTGILNCTVLEPAFAYKDEAAHSESNGDSDCCFIHCTTCHQWVTSQSSVLTHPVLLLADVVPASVILHHDSPVGSIFHPPLAR